MLILLIPLAWLAAVAFVLILCRCGARADATVAAAVASAEEAIVPAAPIPARAPAERTLRAARLHSAPTLRVRDGRRVLVGR